MVEEVVVVKVNNFQHLINCLWSKILSVHQTGPGCPQAAASVVIPPSIVHYACSVLSCPGLSLHPIMSGQLFSSRSWCLGSVLPTGEYFKRGLPGSNLDVILNPLRARTSIIHFSSFIVLTT